MKGRSLISLFISLAVVLFLFAVTAFSVSAEVPKKINYQGYLTDSYGAVDGTVDMKFCIYDTDSGGTALWCETQSVGVNAGIYSVVLGDGTLTEGAPLENLSFDTQYYLGVTAGTDAEMTPRQTFTAVPYAFRAVTADSVAASSVTTAAIEDNAVTGSKISSGAVTAGKIGAGAVGSTEILDGSISGGPGGDIADGTITADDIAPGVVPDGHSLDAADGSPVDAVYVDNDGKVGIGTTSPTTKLHIKGNSQFDGITKTQEYTYYTYQKNGSIDIDCGTTYDWCNDCDTGWANECPSTFDTLVNEGTSCYDGYWAFFDCRAYVYERIATTTTSATSPTLLHMDAYANLGIGTASPQGKLHTEDIIYDRYLIGCPPGYLVGDFDGQGDAIDCKATGLVVLDSGWTGIGTTSPSSALDVSGVITASGGNSTSWNSAYSLGSAAYAWGDHAVVGYDTTDDLWTGTGNIYMTSGYVGIGTNAPKEALHVTGSYYGLGHLYLYAWEGDGVSGTAYVQARDDSGTSDINLRLRTQNAGSMVEAVTITKEGYVGIGTTTPDANLEVHGTMKVFGERAKQEIEDQTVDAYFPATPVTAQSDGFLVCVLAVDDEGSHPDPYVVARAEGWIDDPLDSLDSYLAASASINQWSGTDWPVRTNSFTMPVRKGETWQIEYIREYGGTPVDIVYYFIPLGQ